MSKSGSRVGPIGGMLFVLSVIVSAIVYQGVDVEPSDSVSTVLAAYAENSASIQIAAAIGLLGLGFLLLFIGDMRTRMRDRGAGWASDAFLAGGLAMVGGWVVLAGVDLAGGVAGESGHAEVAQWAADFIWNGSFLFSPGLLAVGVATAVASFTSRTIPTWLGVFSVVVAVGAVFPWLGIFVFVLWVLAASIASMISVKEPAADMGA